MAVVGECGPSPLESRRSTRNTAALALRRILSPEEATAAVCHCDGRSLSPSPSPSRAAKVRGDRGGRDAAEEEGGDAEDDDGKSVSASACNADMSTTAPLESPSTSSDSDGRYTLALTPTAPPPLLLVFVPAVEFYSTVVGEENTLHEHEALDIDD